jgi:hypothetical protein
MTKTKCFRGINGRDVYVASFGLSKADPGLRTLDPRIDLRNFAPDAQWQPEFRWGSVCPGAGQLALALLADVLPDQPREAVALSDIFLDRVISRLTPHEPWIMSDNVVRAFAASISQKAQVAA